MNLVHIVPGQIIKKQDEAKSIGGINNRAINRRFRRTNMNGPYSFYTY